MRKERNNPSRLNILGNYLEVLKPRETILLLSIGVCSAIIATNATIYPPSFMLIFLALLLGSAGCNGLTNYLDREVDARAKRTQKRVLPSKRIYPPEKVLPIVISLIIASLIIAWILNPLCFLIGVVGIIASALWRKTISCTFLGIIAGVSPVLIGWFSVNPSFTIMIILITLLVACWIPIHVWSVMIANRDDYLNAGLTYFPINVDLKIIIKVLLFFAIIIYIISLLLYLVTSFHLLYLFISNILGIVMIVATAHLLTTTSSLSAWRVYKLSSYPYLGILFITMCLDLWLL